MVLLREGIPEAFDLNGTFGIAILPQEIDHLAIRADGCSLTTAEPACDDAPDGRIEPVGIAFIADRELGQGLARIEQLELARTTRRRDIDAELAELPHKCASMGG